MGKFHSAVHNYHWECDCGIRNLLARENCLGCNCLRPDAKHMKITTEQGFLKRITPYRINRILETLKKSQIQVKQ